MGIKPNYILSLFRANLGWVMLGAISIFITSFSLALSADYIRQITNHIQNAGLNGLWALIAFACAAQIIHYITKYGLAVSCRNLSFKLCRILRIDLMKYWLRMPFASFERKQAGQYLSIAQNDADNASFYVYVLFSRIGMSVFNVMMAIPFMLRINIGLTAIVLAVSIGFGIINQRVLIRIKENEARGRAAQENLCNTALKSFDSADSIKVYGAGTYIAGVYLRFRMRYSKALLNVVGIDSIRNGFYILVQNITLYGSIIYLAWQTLAGYSTLGETLSFNILLTQALVAVEMIFRWSGALVRCNASWERLESEMSESLQESEQESKQESKQESNISEYANISKISISGLSYRYSDTTSVFENLSLEFEKGIIHQINGESGSGKTTLIKCLLGIYDVDNARYTIDGIPADQNLVAGLISYVPSEHFLFEGTIYENLSLGNDGTTKKHCRNMADILGLGNWLGSLPGQLDYLVESGGRNFSGGQRQMLCILRALLFRRPVLVLDEPFSSLDDARVESLRDMLQVMKVDHIILLTSHRSQALGFEDMVIEM